MVLAYREKQVAEHDAEINQIISRLTCSKNFVCYTSGFKILCKARYIGGKSFLDNLVECLEGNPKKCQFANQFKNHFFCTCPLRIYLVKKGHQSSQTD